MKSCGLRYLLPVGVALLFVSAAHLHAAGVSIKVLNGSNLPGYARQAGEFLKKKGYRVDRVDSAEKSFLVTTTYFKAHSKDAAKEVSGILPGPQEIKPLSWESQFDIIIVMGSKGADPSALRVRGEPAPSAKKGVALPASPGRSGDSPSMDAARTLRQSAPPQTEEPAVGIETAPATPSPTPPTPTAVEPPEAGEEDFEMALSEDAEPTPPPMEDTAPAPQSAAPSETDDEFSSLAFDDEEPQEKPAPLEEFEEIEIEPETEAPAPATQPATAGQPTPVAKPQPKPATAGKPVAPPTKPAPGKVKSPKPASKPAQADKPRPIAVPKPEHPKPPPKVSGADYMEIAAADLVKQAGEVLGKFVKVEDAFLDQSNYFLGMRQFEIGPNEFVEFFSGKSRVNLIIYVPKSNGAAVSVLKGLSRGDKMTIYGKVLAKNPIGRPLLIADRLEKL